jgi:cell division protein ZapA (FtsZ GTPase activity inhibitor)
MANKVNVVINGDVTTIVSDEPVEYVQKLAHYTGQKIEEATSRYEKVMITERQKTFLVALNIADDYLKVEPELKKLRAENKKLLAEHTYTADENAKLTKLVKDLRLELAKYKDGEEDKVVTLPLANARKVTS